MLNEKKAIAVFKDVLNAAINFYGMKYPMEYDYCGKRYQICFDGCRLYVIPHTIPDAEFAMLPQEKDDSFNIDFLKPTFDSALYHGENVVKGRINVAELKRGIREVKQSALYNEVINITPEISVTHYAHKEPFRKKPAYNRVVVIFNDKIAVPAKHLIQTLELFKGANIKATEWNKPVYFDSINEDAHALIMPMSNQFWEEMKRGAIEK